MRTCAVLVILIGLFSTSAAAVAPVRSLHGAAVVEVSSLRSIAGWLKQHGREGFVGADVADALGIPRHAGEALLGALQQGYRSEDVLRIAQLAADDERHFMLFMVQRPDDQVFFYLSSVREGLKRAFVSIPSKNLVVPLERGEAEAGFLQELLYWEDKIPMR
jgi:hypothetical protein